MTKLFSYVVQHDHGFAPNPQGGCCSLAKCKYGSKKRNIVEMAREGDWIVGTGGVDLEVSAGHGKVIYAMRVERKVSLETYCRDSSTRIDAEQVDHERDRFALLSNHFFYFGRNAIDISEIPSKHLDHPFEKTGPGYRCDFSSEFIEDFVTWLESTFKVGMHGPPCKPHSKVEMPKCPSVVRRKRQRGQ